MNTKLRQYKLKFKLPMGQMAVQDVWAISDAGAIGEALAAPTPPGTDRVMLIYSDPGLDLRVVMDVRR